MQHTIRIDGERGAYSVSGAVTLAESRNPIPDAARALLTAGASPDDMLNAIWPDATFVPMPLSKFMSAPKPTPSSFRNYPVGVGL
jgi:hypothetical protein